MASAGMPTVDQVFDRYEAIRPRLPAVLRRGAMAPVGSLVDLADEGDVFVFDAYGVLNVGERAIPGARACVAALRRAGKTVRVLSNAASYGPAGARAKFAALGFDFAPEEIVTSRAAAARALPGGRWAAIADARDDFPDLPVEVVRLERPAAQVGGVDGVLLLSSADWDAGRQEALVEALRRTPRPVVVANADVAAPREDGLTWEPGYYGHDILDRTAVPVSFHGKPFESVYALVEASLGPVDPGRIVMSGDALHTDVLGANVRGWRSVLVTRDGMFGGQDATGYARRSGIHPDWIAGRV